MVKFTSFLVIGVVKLVKAGPGDDKTRVVQCLSGTANIGFSCGSKYRPANSEQDVFYFASCKFDDTDYENRPEVVACAPGQQCFTTIKNFDPNGSIVDDVYDDDKGNKHAVVAEFGCGDSGRYKGDWTEYFNDKFKDEFSLGRNKYFGQEAICYGDDTDGTDLWSGNDFSQRDLTCYCLDNECNRQFELPWYIQTHLTYKRDSGASEETGSADDSLDESYEDDEDYDRNSGTESSGNTPSVTESNLRESQQTEYREYSDDEDAGTEDTRQEYNTPTERQITEYQQPTEAATTERPVTQRRTEQPQPEQTPTEENRVTEEKNSENDQQTGSEEIQQGSTGMSGLEITLLILLFIETVLIAVIYITGNIPGKGPGRTRGPPQPANPEAQPLN